MMGEQHRFDDKKWPVAQNDKGELIPGAAILQTNEEGKDDPITLAGAYQWDEAGKAFRKVNKDNPLEVRVRQLETELQQLRSLLQDGNAKVQLKGSVVEDLHEIRKAQRTYYPVGVEVTVIDKLSDLLGESVHQAARVLWMGDHDGEFQILYRVFNDVYFSGDGGKTSVRVGPAGTYGDVHWGLVVPGRAIMLGTRNDGVPGVWRSEVFDSAVAGNWQRVLTPPSGVFNSTWGRCCYGDVVCLATYGNHDPLDPPRHLCISRDAGATWKTIEIEAVSDMPDPTRFHLHDVEYDPWSGRIWLSNGDGDNSGLRYSDDWGETWTLIRDRTPGQPTNILALPDRVIFARDYMPGGLSVWRKPKGMTNPVVAVDDIEFLYHVGDPSVPIETNAFIPEISQSMVTSQTASFPYSLVVLMNQSGLNVDVARIIGSPDGEQWYELFRLDQLGDNWTRGTIHRITGPVQNDPQKRVYALAYDNNNTEKILRMRYPDWVQRG